MKDLILCLVVCLGVLAIGIFIGYSVHPTCSWDIMDDPRSCYIYWDDGTVSWKSRITYIGKLEPGESKELKCEGTPLKEVEG